MTYVLFRDVAVGQYFFYGRNKLLKIEKIELPNDTKSLIGNALDMHFYEVRLFSDTAEVGLEDCQQSCC